jgi:hypothetical protein
MPTAIHDCPSVTSVMRSPQFGNEHGARLDPLPERRRVISDQTLTELRVALQQRLGGSTSDAEIRQALRAMSEEAHAESLKVEQVIVALKRVWESLPEVRRASDRLEQNRVLERVVTLCIEEYYADEG